MTEEKTENTEEKAAPKSRKRAKKDETPMRTVGDFLRSRRG